MESMNNKGNHSVHRIMFAGNHANPDEIKLTVEPKNVMVVRIK